MKVNGRIGIATMLVFVLALFATAVTAIDIQITETEINGIEAFPNDFVQLDLERGDELELRVELVALDDLDDVEVRATLLSSEEDIDEVLELFDTREDKKYVKTLKLDLPQELDQDEYKILLIISDRDNEELTETYRVFVNSPRHKLMVEDVILQPFGRVNAGEYLLGKVRLENFGQKDQDDVRVTMSLPELDVQATSYIDSIEFDDQEDTEEMLLRIPVCAEEGQYRVNVLAEYNEGRDHVVSQDTIWVMASDACKHMMADDAKEDSAVVVVLSEPQADADAAVEETSAPSSTRKALEVVLLALVVLLVIIGLLIGLMKLRSDE